MGHRTEVVRTMSRHKLQLASILILPLLVLANPPKARKDWPKHALLPRLREADKVVARVNLTADVWALIDKEKFGSEATPARVVETSMDENISSTGEAVPQNLRTRSTSTTSKTTSRSYATVSARESEAMQAARTQYDAVIATLSHLKLLTEPSYAQVTVKTVTPRPNGTMLLTGTLDPRRDPRRGHVAAEREKLAALDENARAAEALVTAAVNASAPKENVYAQQENGRRAAEAGAKYDCVVRENSAASTPIHAAAANRSAPYRIVNVELVIAASDAGGIDVPAWLTATTVPLFFHVTDVILLPPIPDTDIIAVIGTLRGTVVELPE